MKTHGDDDGRLTQNQHSPHLPVLDHAEFTCGFAWKARQWHSLAKKVLKKNKVSFSIKIHALCTSLNVKCRSLLFKNRLEMVIMQSLLPLSYAVLVNAALIFSLNTAALRGASP
jgi:hypothetical protein